MTIKELLDSVKALRANTYTDAELTAWLNRLERNVWHNLVVTHARFDGLPEELPVYDALTDDETRTDDPPLHDEIYIHYLCMQIDLYNNELIKYAKLKGAVQHGVERSGELVEQELPAGQAHHLL